MKRVMCFGTFDKLHKGHVFYLQKSKKLSDYLIVVIARDENVRKLKGKIPADNEKIRLKNVENLEFVDKALLGSKKNKFEVVKKYKPDIISLGYDQRVDIDELKKNFSGEIIRQKAFKPDVYKSSLM